MRLDVRKSFLTKWTVKSWKLSYRTRLLSFYTDFEYWVTQFSLEVRALRQEEMVSHLGSDSTAGEWKQQRNHLPWMECKREHIARHCATGNFYYYSYSS